MIEALRRLWRDWRWRRRGQPALDWAVAWADCDTCGARYTGPCFCCPHRCDACWAKPLKWQDQDINCVRPMPHVTNFDWTVKP